MVIPLESCGFAECMPTGIFNNLKSRETGRQLGLLGSSVHLQEPCLALDEPG